jgi:hypothetical protein
LRSTTIVPYDAAKLLIQKIGSIDKEEVMLKGGHVSLVAGANAIKRLWPKLDSWLGENRHERHTFLPATRQDRCGEIEFRLMSRTDEVAVLDFAKSPTHDLLFLPRNISQPKVLSAWINEIERGDITSLLAVQAGKVVGCGTLVRDPIRGRRMSERSEWWCHRMFAARASDALSQQTFALALGPALALSVQMTVDQQAAIALFEASASRRACCASMCGC